MNAAIISELNTIITKEELVRNFEVNKFLARAAWQTVRECRRHHKVEEETKHLANYYRIVFENEDIAKILKAFGFPEYWEEAMSAEYSRMLTA